MNDINHKDIFKVSLDTYMRSVIWLAVLVLLESLLLLAILALIYSFIPFKLDAMVYKMFPLFIDQIRPEREMRFFVIFIVFNILVQGLGLIIFHKRLNDVSWLNRLRGFVVMETFWVFLTAFAAFKIFVFGNPLWARALLWFALAASIVSKVFWSELTIIIPKIVGWLIDSLTKKIFRRVVDGIAVLLIALVIFVPDLPAVLGRVFVWDQFFHIDMFVMSAALAHHYGCALNVDVISLYSVVIPVIVGHLMEWMGGMSYERLFYIFMMSSIGYYALCYGILRSWTKSLAVSLMAVFLLIKLQMFHGGVIPIIWRYPSVTVIRHLFDLIVVWSIIRHAQTLQRRYLFIAAAGCGIMLAWMIDVGLSLTVGFYAYLMMLLLIPDLRRKTVRSRRDVWGVVAIAIFPIAAAFFIVFLFQGFSIFSAVFYRGYWEFMSIFLYGWGSLPVTDGLKDKQFFAFVMGFVILGVYVFTLLFTGALCLMRRIDYRNVCVVFLCVYGIMLFHYFVGRSASSSYYVVVMPFVFIIAWWYQKIVKCLNGNQQKIIGALAVFWTLGALLTGYLFTYYPNVFNLARVDLEKEKTAYQEQFDLSVDAQLISELVPKQEKVVLLSSFETRILMQAQRPPFFYYFPMIESAGMNLNHFRATSLYTRARMKKTLEDLEHARPRIVFVEKKLIRREISPEYFAGFATLGILIDYFDKHYDFFKEGQYLIAMKRKGTDL